VGGVGVTSSSGAPAPSWTASEAANVETVRTAIEAFNSGDVEAMLKIGYADRFEYDWSRSMGPNRGIYRGVDGFMEFIHDQWSTFESVTLEAHDFIPRGQHVVVPTTTHGRGRQGVSVTAKSAQLYTFDNGRLVRITLYPDRDQALAAAS
jgi:ketosteroid isomerase-like protein